MTFGLTVDSEEEVEEEVLSIMVRGGCVDASVGGI